VGFRNGLTKARALYKMSGPFFLIYKEILHILPQIPPKIHSRFFKKAWYRYLNYRNRYYLHAETTGIQMKSF
jgi:hypothetical protein